MKDDYISRQAAINAIGNIPDYDDGMVFEALSHAIRDIALLPSAQPEQQWIPCSERLPDIKEHHVSEPCIVYCSNGAYAFAELEENIFGQVGWNCERDDEYHGAVGEVVAWMPLPEPYEEGE